MKAITFLGATEAYETAYVMADGRQHVAPFFGVALARFYPDLDLRVLVTQEARNKHLSRFTALVEDYAHSVQDVDIPIGRDEAEMWRIFEAVIESVDEDEEVIFDITHGFRSLPFLSFLAAAYLGVIKNVHMKAVLYGNFEARDKDVSPNRAPVIDLTPFVSLLDWMVAADRFTRFGDAQDLAALLNAARPRQQWPDRPTAQQRAASLRLSQAARSLKTISAALRLIRPIEALAAAADLPQALDDATPEVAAYARPFMPLVQGVTAAFAAIALPQAAQADIVQQLAHERQLVYWYLARQQYAQALTTAREWIVTWLMAHTGSRDQTDNDARDVAEKTLGYESQRRNPHRKERAREPVRRLALDDIPDADAAVKLYAELGDVRNDMLHAGKRKNAAKADTLADKITRLCGQIDNLSLPAADG